MTEVDGKVHDKIDLKQMINKELMAANAIIKKVKHKKIIAKFSIDKNLAIEGNSIIYARIFRNVFKNALYYSQSNEKPTLKVKAIQDSGTKQCIISVSNNGKPVDKDIENKLFDAFFTTREIGQGIGTGLSVAKSLLENMNGEIILTDTGRDSGWVVFELRLPVLHI